TEVLGAELAAIAADKAAVARAHVPLVVGPLPSAARVVVAAQAEHVGAPLLQPAARLAGMARAVVDDALELALPAPSQALADCAAIAFGCLQALDLFPNPPRIAAQGMRNLVLPGRLEVLGREPLLIADS